MGLTHYVAFFARRRVHASSKVLAELSSSPCTSGDQWSPPWLLHDIQGGQYHIGYIKKYDEGLTTTLIFMCCPSPTSINYITWSVLCSLLSALLFSSMFIWIFNPTLCVTFLTLNQFTIPGETHTVLSVQEYPPKKIATVTCPMYTGLLISLVIMFDTLSHIFLSDLQALELYFTL